jgi:deazaflavin-dependent oxidoreductase (nitroreductase family)
MLRGAGKTQGLPLPCGMATRRNIRGRTGQSAVPGASRPVTRREMDQASGNRRARPPCGAALTSVSRVGRCCEGPGRHRVCPYHVVRQPAVTSAGDGLVPSKRRPLTGAKEMHVLDDSEEVFDSPTGWVAKHIKEYVETDGRKGFRFIGANTLLLTTRGRKSGKLRRTALIFGEDEGRYVVVASNGGAKRHPNWYGNLAAEPAVGVQVKAERFTARARTAAGGERERLWVLMTGIYRAYDDYQRKTEREIPVVVLEQL